MAAHPATDVFPCRSASDRRISGAFVILHHLERSLSNTCMNYTPVVSDATGGVHKRFPEALHVGGVSMINVWTLMCNLGSASPVRTNQVVIQLIFKLLTKKLYDSYIRCHLYIFFVFDSCGTVSNYTFRDLDLCDTPVCDLLRHGIRYTTGLHVILTGLLWCVMICFQD